MAKHQAADPAQLIIEIGIQPVPKHRRGTPASPTQPRWSKYRAVDPHPCDFCKLNQVEDPYAPVARKARWRRSIGTEPYLLLCSQHANDQRTVDGMPKFKTPRA